MKRKILIVEDEPIIAQDLSFILHDIGINDIDLVHSFDDALIQLTQKTYDLVLLDIHISSEKDGVDLAHHINQHYKTPFIFITSFYNKSTVARAKLTQPQAYILKPFNKQDIRVNIEMVLYKLDQTKEDRLIYLREKKGTVQINLSEIVYLEALDNYTKVVTTDHSMVISQTLKSMMNKLPDEDFIRTHKSFAVRLDRITTIKGNHTYLDDTKIPIGRTYKEEFQSRIALL